MQPLFLLCYKIAQWDTLNVSRCHLIECSLFMLQEAYVAT